MHADPIIRQIEMRLYAGQHIVGVQHRQFRNFFELVSLSQDIRECLHQDTKVPVESLHLADGKRILLFEIIVALRILTD